MKSLSRRHTYRSLIISLILHSLLFLLCVYLSVHVPQELPEGLGSRTPARVSMQVRPQTQVSGVGTSSNTQPVQAAPLPVPLPAKRPAKPAQKVIPSMTSQSAPETSQRTEGPPQSVGTRGTLGSGSGEGRAGSGGLSTGTTSSGGSSTVSGATFMRAFHNSIQSYREELAEQKPARNSHIPEHVQERIDVWNQFDHYQKVHRALVKATRIYTAFVHTAVPINIRIPFTLVTDEKGTLLTKIEGPFTGHVEIDHFLKEFLTKTEYPPIPKRFNKKEFQFNITIQLTLSEGSHRLQLRALAE